MESTMERGAVRRGLAVAATAAATLALIGVGASGAAAINQGSAHGNRTVGCSVMWDASSVLKTNLQNDDPDYPNLMVRPDGSPVDSYSNGGYIQDVRPEYGDHGLLEINHWYDGVHSPVDPAVAQEPTGVNWRVPIASDQTLHDVTFQIQLPAGTDFELGHGEDIAAWGGSYANYRWLDPEILIAPSPDGLSWEIVVSEIPAGTGLVLDFRGTVPAGTVLSDPAVAEAKLTGTLEPGAATCPQTSSGNGSAQCEVDWATDATQVVTSSTEPSRDVTRRQAVAPELGDPGKFGIDGWSDPPAGDTATLHGRFVLASDHPVEQATWVLHFPEAIERPETAIVNPADGWRVDDRYPNPVAIDEGVWDPAARTLAFQVSVPASGSVIVEFHGTIPAGSYLRGASFEYRAELHGRYAAGVPGCEPPMMPGEP
ncbi:MAG: hypothetical protein Q4E05_12065, partial [Pseudoclavibacter sp.]|nr:hypothetical protein [Pseudoclavibacter sp.]